MHDRLPSPSLDVGDKVLLPPGGSTSNGGCSQQMVAIGEEDRTKAFFRNLDPMTAMSSMPWCPP